MSVLSLLSSSKGEKGNEANIALAEEIAIADHHEAIRELVENLNHDDKKIQGDCIKVLYETAYIKPEMIADYHTEFLDLLNSKNNRMVWGAMIALLTITDLKHGEIYTALDRIMETVDKGSVITIDCGVEILAKLNKHEEYADKTEPLLVDLLWKCPIKQLPQYMEKSIISVHSGNKEIYRNIIKKRQPECEKDSQIKRLQRVSKQIENIR